MQLGNFGSSTENVFLAHQFWGLTMQNVLVRDNSAIVQPSGSLNAANVVKFQHLLNNAVLSAEYTGLVVDMGMVESIDSAGLMALVSALKAAQQLNKRFCLCAVSQHIHMVLEMTQLDRVFEIVERPVVAEALAA